MKDATVSVRVECDVKNEAEEILRRIGVPVSVSMVINSLYRQIIFQSGMHHSRGRGSSEWFGMRSRILVARRSSGYPPSGRQSDVTGTDYAPVTSAYFKSGGVMKSPDRICAGKTGIRNSLTKRRMPSSWKS